MFFKLIYYWTQMIDIIQKIEGFILHLRPYENRGQYALAAQR